MKNIFITGVSGFIGSALANVMHEKNYIIKGGVRTISENIPNYVEQIPYGNISPDTKWESALNGVDTVVHLAARVHVMQDAAKNPLQEFRRINTEATLIFAKQAAEKGVKRFIYLSTIKVNGETTELDKPFTEYDKFVPVDPYALSKYEAELGLLQLAKNTKMEVVIIRPPLVYGPCVKSNFLSLMKWLNKSIPLPFGAIHNKRSLVAIDNLVDFIVTCVEHPAAANEIFLVSDDEDISINVLLSKVAFMLGKKAMLLPVNQRVVELCLGLIGKKDVAQRFCGSLQVDISKAKKILGWRPLTSVDVELKKTTEYFLNRQL